MLSISIVTYQLVVDEFLKLLESLASAMEEAREYVPDFQIFIIDNGDESAEIEKVCQASPAFSGKIKIISGKGNVGYGGGHNQCLDYLNSEYHLILNPDVVFDRSCLLHGLSYLAQCPDVVAVAPDGTDDCGNPLYLAKRYPGIIVLMIRGLGMANMVRELGRINAKYQYEDLVKSATAGEIELMSGCFILCRTKALLEIGGFDKTYFLYFEDFALSIALRRKGKLVYLPDMKIIHGGGNAGRKGIKHVAHFIFSGYRFFNDYGWKIL